MKNFDNNIPKALFIALTTIVIVFNSCSKKDATTPPVTPPTDTTQSTLPPYQLVWSDEFDADGLPDNTKWGYDVGGGGWGNNELEYYTDSKTENARVENGNLVIEVRKENAGGRNYTSARLITKGKAEWTYGRFDIKAQLPTGRGLWPAIWLLSATDPLSWPSDGELDIMEEVGFDQNRIYGTAHNLAYNGANGLQKGSNRLVDDADKSFHLYSLEWTPDAVTWFIDSTQFYKYPDPKTGPDKWPYFKDFYMILNIAVGGNWGGQQGVDDSIFPQQMLIDYVRVYQRK